MDEVKTLKQYIDESKRIVVFTGAGISTASNIPDFRSSNGIYNEKLKINYRPEEVISHSFFEMNPKFFYDFYFSKMVYPNAKPNAAHLYFADLSKSKDVKVVTQNIDGLHQKAGSKIVYELHGSVLRNYCQKCHKFYQLEDIPHSGIPYCKCGGIIKPDVVLYEEGLDDNTVTKSIEAISKADLMIVIGTSLVVYPAASFVRYFRGNHLVIINKDSTDYDSNCNLVIHDDIIKVVKELNDLQ